MLIVYDDSHLDIFGKIYDTTGGLSAEFQIDQASGPGDSPQPSSRRRPMAASSQRGAPFLREPLTSLRARFNSDGVAMGQQFTVNRLTDNQQFDPTVAVSGANAFFAWNDVASRPGDTSPRSVRGQVMSLTTPPDFNDNGVSDILWRNASGGLVAWDMNRNGSINGERVCHLWRRRNRA